MRQLVDHFLYNIAGIGNSSCVLSLIHCTRICFCPQFGNTCYANSVLQALFYCQPFREKVLSYSPPECEEGGGSGQPETLLSVLADLFLQIAQSKKKVGVLHPKKFISKVKKENGELFISQILN